MAPPVVVRVLGFDTVNAIDVTGPLQVFIAVTPARLEAQGELLGRPIGYGGAL